MYEITPSVYLELAHLLSQQVADKEFFSGVVSCDDGDVQCRLVCTIVIARERWPQDGRAWRAIERILPVWWELQTIAGGELIANDFSFKTLCRAVLDGEC